MTLYHVHVYREMRLYFPAIEARRPEEAARIAADRPTDEAQYTEDCDGDNLAALIDVDGDSEFTQSITIDFEAEQERKASPELLAALQGLLAAAADLDAAIDGATDQLDEERAALDAAHRIALDAVAQAATGQSQRRPG